MRGVLTFVFDDGYEAVWQHVVPLLNQLKIPAVFALPINTQALAQTVPEPLTPWAAWLPLQRQGHEIAAHTVSHVDIRTLSGEALDQELRIPRERLKATTFVYPGGAYNESVINQVKKQYTAARTTNYGFESIPPSNPWLLKNVDYTKSNFSVFKANARALWAWTANRWLIETYHLVDKKPSTMHHSVLFDDFKNHVEFIRKLPIAVQTIHETVGHRHN